jgi:hypothetical protein
MDPVGASAAAKAPAPSVMSLLGSISKAPKIAVAVPTSGGGGGGGPQAKATAIGLTEAEIAERARKRTEGLPVKPPSADEHKKRAREGVASNDGGGKKRRLPSPAASRAPPRSPPVPPGVVMKDRSQPAGGKEYFTKNWSDFLESCLGMDPKEAQKELDALVPWSAHPFQSYRFYGSVATAGGFEALDAGTMETIYERGGLKKNYRAGHPEDIKMLEKAYDDYFMHYERCHPDDIPGKISDSDSDSDSDEDETSASESEEEDATDSDEDDDASDETKKKKNSFKVRLNVDEKKEKKKRARPKKEKPAKPGGGKKRGGGAKAGPGAIDESRVCRVGHPKVIVGEPPTGWPLEAKPDAHGPGYLYYAGDVYVQYLKRATGNHVDESYRRFTADGGDGGAFEDTDPKGMEEVGKTQANLRSKVAIARYLERCGVAVGDDLKGMKGRKKA